MKPATATVTVGFGIVSTVTLGDSVNVQATISGLTLAGTWPQPTGTVDFKFQRNSGSWTYIGTANIPSAQMDFTPQNAGTYTFEAVYQGDVNYVSGTKGVSSTSLTVNPAQASVTMSLSSTGTIQYGDSVSASLTITTSAAGSPPDAIGTWKVQASKDSTFAKGVATVDSGKVTGSLQGAGFTVTTKSWTPTSVGTWYFKATYSGDCSIVNYLTPKAE